MRAEFLPQDPVGDLSVPSSTGLGTLYVWRLVNGFWGLVSAAYSLIPICGSVRFEKGFDASLCAVALRFVHLHRPLLHTRTRFESSD